MSHQLGANDDYGRFEFSPISSGTYLIRIESTVFKNHELTDVIVEKEKLMNIEMILEPAGQGEFVGILLAEPSLLEIPPGTMIINETMIKRLPHQK